MSTGHSGEVVERESREAVVGTALREPRKYRVILLNDDYTPMEFVVRVLQELFHLPAHTAVEIMMQVHTRGRAVCGVYTRDVAETRVIQVEECAMANQHPLRCCMEPE